MDHVPPRGIFAAPKPQLITVPACSKSNPGSSELDEQFKVFLSLRVGDATTSAMELFKNGALRSIRANRKLHQELLSGPKVWVRMADGSISETVPFKWHAPSHDRTIEKITRGLYWHHWHEVLPPDAQVRTYFFARMDEQMLAIAHSMPRANIGGDDCFVYAFERMAENPIISCWFFQFYRGHRGAAITAPSCTSSMRLKTVIFERSLRH
jgi:hypothetical protein